MSSIPPEFTAKFAEINNMLSTPELTCDADCQKLRIGQKLKDTYESALDCLENGPSLVRDSFKRYITYTQGVPAFEKLNKHQLTVVATQHGVKMQDTFVKTANKIDNSINVYDQISTNYTNVIDLRNRVVDENVSLKKQIQESRSNTLVNERKTVYEEQERYNLYMYYKILAIGYACAFVFFLWTSFKPNKELPSSIQSSHPISKKVKIGVAIILAVYPFTSIWIYNWIAWIYALIISVFPTNVARG
jgi:hypothetical protein